MLKTKKERSAATQQSSMNRGTLFPISFFDSRKCIQHNVSIEDGLEPVIEFMKKLPSDRTSVRVCRAIEDSDYSVVHSKCSGARSGFLAFPRWRAENYKTNDSKYHQHRWWSTLAIAWTGTLFLEIIQPLTPDAIYGHDLTDKAFTLRLHHIAFSARDWDDLVLELAAEGKSLAFSGELGGMIHSGYWEGRTMIGTYVEFYLSSPEGEAVWEQIRKG